MILCTTADKAAREMNRLGSQNLPFVFLVDFEMQKILISTDLSSTKDLSFDINGRTNTDSDTVAYQTAFLDVFPMDFAEYTRGFDQATSQIQLGNSFLLNLTYPTRIVTTMTLPEIYRATQAKYKIYLKDQFVCFSPEIFIQIVDGRISSHPMKGTIDASIPDAEASILADDKELSEHFTIVDLIRNDLSRVAKNVIVDRFRYIDHISTDQKDLLQVSSEISGQLPTDYTDHIGTILFSLLPAGSISGAPKKKTVEIIANAESGPRGYYTGICGHFDGRDLDSGVMIRYIEQDAHGEMHYRSGCGITSQSNLVSEYQEMIDKVYLPLHSKLADPYQHIQVSSDAQ